MEKVYVISKNAIGIITGGDSTITCPMFSIDIDSKIKWYRENDTVSLKRTFTNAEIWQFMADNRYQQRGLVIQSEVGIKLFFTGTLFNYLPDHSLENPLHYNTFYKNAKWTINSILSDINLELLMSRLGRFI